MFTSRKALQYLTLSITAVLALPAVAASSASAGVSGLRFELIDLNPDDGIQASMKWISRSGSSQVDFTGGQGFELFALPNGGYEWAISHSVLESANDDQPSHFSSKAVLGGSDSGQVQARSDETSLLTETSTQKGGVKLNALSSMAGSFSLSAHTELRLTGMAELNMSGSGREHVLLPSGVAPPDDLLFSRANPFLSIYLGSDSFSAQLDGDSFAYSSDPGSRPLGDYADSLSKAFSLSLRNEGGSVLDSYYSVVAQTTLSQLAVSPAPEPAAYLMWSLGAGVLGWSARRSRRRSA